MYICYDTIICYKYQYLVHELAVSFYCILMIVFINAGRKRYTGKSIRYNQDTVIQFM